MIERDQYDCNTCRYQFPVTSGTIFMTESNKGMSALQIKRTIDVSYETAWYLCHRIRAAMREIKAALLRGIVEVDETYVGGKVHGMGHGYKGSKAIAIGAVQRKGKIRLRVITHANKATLHKFIHDNTAPDTEALYTDELPAYWALRTPTRNTNWVNHSSEEWVVGDVHANGIERVWSLLNRSIIGSYHKVSIKHLDAYLDKLEHRLNNRKNEDIFRDTLTKLVKGAKLPYQALVKAA